MDWVTKRLGAGETYEEAEDQARGGKAGLNQGSHFGDGDMRAQIWVRASHSFITSI